MKYVSFIIVLFAPTLLFAETCNPLFAATSVRTIATMASHIIPYVIALAIIVFIWTFAQMYLSEGDEEEEYMVGTRIGWIGACIVFVVVLVGFSTALEHIAAIPSCENGHTSLPS